MSTRIRILIFLGGICAWAIVSTTLAMTGTVKKRWVFDPKRYAGPYATGKSQVYAAVGDVVHALDSETGSQRWESSTSGHVADLIVSVSENYLIAISENYPSKTVVTSLDPESGMRCWKVEIPTVQSDVGTCAALAGDALFIANQTVYAVDIRSGRRLWKYTPPDAGTDPHGHNVGAVDHMVVVGNRLFAAFDSPVLALEALDIRNGKRLWQAPLSKDVLGGYSMSTFVVATQNGTVAVASPDGTVSAFDSRSGEKRWTTARDLVYLPHLLDTGDGGLIAASWDGGVVRISEQSGKVEWRTKIGIKEARSPVIGPDRKLYVGATPNKVFVMNPRTGETERVLPLGYNLVHAAFGYPDYVFLQFSTDGELYAGSTDGRLFALQN